MKLRSYLLIAVSALILAAPADGIIDGQPDGNGHPNAGAVDVRPTGRMIPASGTLVSPTVFVTAGHVTNFFESKGITQARVTFDPVFSDTAKFYTGTVHTNPGFFTGTASDPGDIGVIVFAKPVKGITPAVLPTAGLLDELGPQGLNSQTFVEVGYGISAVSLGGGPPEIDRSSAGTRRTATESFNSLTNTILHLSVINDGKPCVGDSGAPQFLGSSSTVVAEDVTGDRDCTAWVGGYRARYPVGARLPRPVRHAAVTASC